MDERVIFEEIGLTKNEGKIYSELVKHGKLSASEISSKSGVPYGKIYVILSNLVEKGLVEIVPEKTRKYSLTNPDSLMELINNKKKLLDHATEKVKELKRFYEKKEKDFLIIGEGDKGFWKIADEMKKSEKYSYNIRWDSKIRPGSLEKAKEFIRKGVDKRELVRYDKETEKNVDKWLKVQKNIRKFQNEGVAISIEDDEEVLIGLIKKNTTLLIRDASLTKIMKQLFLEAYKNAERV